MACVLGLDVGTTSTVGLLLRVPERGRPGAVLGIASRPATLRSPRPGWAEEDPAEWWANTCAICRELLDSADVAPGELKAVGVSGMLPAVVLLDRDDAVLRPAIQQSDGRAGREVEAMRRERPEADFLAKAGNGINQQLVGAKLRWLETHEPDVYARIGTVFGSYDYVNFRLTSEKRIEQNWALEAGFVAFDTQAIDPDLVAFGHVPAGALPARIASHAILGRVTAEAAGATGLPEGTPVVGGAADFIASALGAGLTQPGDVLLKFGGAIDVLVATDRPKPDARMFLDHHLVPGLWVPNGCMATGGSALNWFAKTFAGGEAPAAAAAGRTLHQHLDHLAAERPAGAEGVMVLPYFLGEKTPIHDPAARGLFSGLTLAHDLGHLWRALLEAYAYAMRHHLDVLNDMGHATTRVLVSDGGANSRTWMSIVADVLQQPVQRLAGHPGSCLGAAWTAAVGTGLTDDWAGAARFVVPGETIAPDPAHAAVYAAGYATYRDLYRRLPAPA